MGKFNAISFVCLSWLRLATPQWQFYLSSSTAFTSFLKRTLRESIILTLRLISISILTTPQKGPSLFAE